jgi:hypothetical protein
LTDQEVTAMEEVVNEAFDGFNERWRVQADQAKIAEE